MWGQIKELYNGKEDVAAIGAFDFAENMSFH